MKKLLLAAATVALASGTAHASSTATGTANATVVSPLNITHSGALEFGAFTAGSGGTITVDATTGVGTASGPTYVSGGPTTSADSFSIAGDGGRTFTISGPATVTLNNGLANMSVNLVFPTGAQTLSATGGYTLKVGGVLNVAANQTPGSYTNTYNVSVAYQ